jgi:GxxExxY protein
MNTDHFESKTGATGLKHSAITEAIIGSLYDVYNELGHGFLESVYREALAVLLAERGQNVEQEKTVTVRFRNSIVGIFRTDLLVNNVVIVEPKCARALDSVHEAQLLNYLKATEFEVGMLLNLGTRPQFRRMLLDNVHKQPKVASLSGHAGDSESPKRPKIIRVDPCKSMVKTVLLHPRML